MSAASVVIGLFLAVYAALAVLAFRRPLLARLALREAVRRPWQSAVVVLGLMVGTSGIFATQVLSDSIVQSSTKGAYLAWGKVDLVVADGGRFFDPALASGLAADLGKRSSTAAVQPGIELPSSVVDLDRNNAKGLVMLVGFDPATQGPFGSYRLKDGRTTTGQGMAADQVLVSASLASALEARAGDRLSVSIGQAQMVELRVAGIAEAQGPGAYRLRPALFSPLANLRRLTADQGINVIRLAIPGEGRAELDRAHRLAPQARAALDGLPGGSSLKVREAKRDEVDLMIKRAESDGAIFSGLSWIVALAGSALVVNLGLALAEERRPRHAVLRALGLGRSGVITLTVLEGALYSLAGAIVALAPGAVVGLALARRLEGGTLLYSNVFEHNAVPVLSPITPGAMALSTAIGSLLVLATLFGTSLKSSRMQVSAAIKNLPDPAPRRKRSIYKIALLAGLGVASLAALVPGNLWLRLGGGVGLVITAAALAGGRISDRLRATITGAAMAAWAATAAVSFASSGAADFQVLLLAALVAVFGLSLIVASNLRLLEIPARRLRGGAGATLRPSLAHLTRRPVRAGLGTGAFALTMAMLTFTAVLIPSFNSALGTTQDEYDIRVSAPTTPGLSLPDSVRPQISREIALPTRPYSGDVHNTGTGKTMKNQYLPLYSLSSAQLASGPFQLTSRDSRFSSDAEVWQALARDPHLVVSPGYQNPGVTLTLQGPDGPVQYRLAAAIKSLGLWGLAGSEAAIAPFANLPVGTTILAKAAPGNDVKEVARQVQRGVFAQGADTTTVKEISDSAFTTLAVVSDFMRLVMGTGLLVGVLSLGILALRAIIDRRRSIGLLRALGYHPGQLLAGIVSEGLIIATSGAAVGILVGVMLARQALTLFGGGGHLEIDLSSLAVVVGLIYLAVLAVTIPPALRAARLRAVDALRLED